MTRLEVGQHAPEFTLPTAGGGQVSLAQLRGGATNGVIVYFYPAAGTPGCTRQASDFEESYANLQEAGYAVVGISPDGAAKLEAFAATENLTYPLASDPDKQVLEAYGAWGEEALRESGGRGDPLDVRGGSRRRAHEGDVQRSRERARGQTPARAGDRSRLG